MAISKSYRCSTKAGLMFCLGFFLLLLRGVYSSNEQVPYDNVELKELISPDSNPEIYKAMILLKLIIKNQQQLKENNQWIGDENGEDLSEGQHPLRFIPLPALGTLKQGSNKRAYLGPCHFKVCNMG